MWTVVGMIGCMIVMCIVAVVRIARVMRCCVLVVMFACRCATRFTKEGEICCARHVRSGHECTDKSDNHEHLVTVIANIVDDFVF